MNVRKGIAIATTLVAFGGGLLAAPGAMAAQKAPTSINDCPSGAMCLWTGKNFSGRMLQYRDTGYWQNLPAQALSYYDNRGDDAAVAPGSGGSGGKTCVDGKSRNSYAHSGVKSVYLAHTGNNC
ncbi:peptidase inhibitor family I36 protein [Streptomyces sp. NPDC021098]|uniref:peptidase inhibitor family I36 protein n=1 Tax=unclassified Streptomyces TaxID=2593676 RepID=UPI003793023E